MTGTLYFTESGRHDLNVRLPAPKVDTQGTQNSRFQSFPASRLSPPVATCCHFWLIVSPAAL